MMNHDKLLEETVKNILSSKKVKYLIAGGSAFLVEYFIFIVINYSSGLLILANIVSFASGFFFSFFLHSKWTFSGQQHHDTKTQMSFYFLLAIINITLTSILINLMVNEALIPAFIAKLLCMALVVVWNFILLNKIIFKLKNDQDENTFTYRIKKK